MVVRAFGLALLVVLPSHGAPVVEHALVPQTLEAGAVSSPDVNGTLPSASQLSDAHVSDSPLHILGKSTPERLERWRAMAEHAKMELQRMGGPTNVTILPHGAMHHHFGSHSADRHAHRQRHEILGEFEDMGGYENITHADVQPRGKAWRRALAAKINAERLGRWKQGEEMLRQRVPAPASLPARA